MRRHTSYRSDNIGKAIYDFRLLTFHLPRGYSNSHLTVKEKEKKSKIHFSESVRLEPLATAAPSRSLAAPPGIKPSCHPLQFASKTSTGSTLLNNQKGAPISTDKTKERTITKAVPYYSNPSSSNLLPRIQGGLTISRICLKET